MSEALFKSSPLITVSQLTAWSHGTWENQPVDIHGVSQNGNNMPSNGLYVALRGEKHDGHNFVAQAAANGAAAALVNQTWQPPETSRLPLLRVADTLTAIAEMAAGRRRDLNSFVIGLTGSAGKTTTKEALAAMLGCNAATFATPGNLNNHVGLPLCLLNMPADVKYGVLEAGSNHPGEINTLASIMQPDAAIITSIGPAHIEFFGSIEAIASEKGDLLRHVPSHGFAVMNVDEPYFEILREKAKCRVITVSLTGPADYTCKFKCDDGIILEITETKSREKHALQSPLSGRHNVLNLMLATAAARALNTPWAAIIAGARQIKLPPMRWERINSECVTVINDAYNANLLSIKCSLSTFSEMKAPGRRVVVLGDMLELGDARESMHLEAGRLVADSNCQILIAVGSCADLIAEGAVKHGFNYADIHQFTSSDAAAAAVAEWAQTEDIILLKASRGIALEKVAKAIDQWSKNISGNGNRNG